MHEIKRKHITKKNIYSSGEKKKTVIQYMSVSLQDII